MNLRGLPKLPLALLALIVLGATLLPMLSPFDPARPSWDELDLPPSLAGGHWLGTDDLGRDLLVRLMWASRISLLVGLAASAMSLAIGLAWGVISGYAGGRVDVWMMRIVDVLYSVPFIPFVIVLTVLFGRDLVLLFVAIGAVSWLDVARIVRGQTLALREREFVVAARVIGVRTPAILARHIVPNLFGIVLVHLTLTIPGVILVEALLSFLGLGAQAPMASLGTMIADGTAQMQNRPLILVAPAVVLAMLVWCCNRLGDALRERVEGGSP
jgi:oligopeptide transport system permease protein